MVMLTALIVVVAVLVGTSGGNKKHRAPRIRAPAALVLPARI